MKSYPVVKSEVMGFTVEGFREEKKTKFKEQL